MARKTGLGKGLGSLIGEASAESGAAPDALLAISEIRRNPDQPRKEFDEQALAELADSIRQNGVLQPILVRKKTEGYEIVAGERRFQAAKLAGLDEIPALVREVSDEDIFKLALIENLQRSDLNPIEEALGYRKLIEEQGLTQEALAKMLSKSRPAIANSLRLLELPEELRDLVAKGALSAGHGRALLTVSDDATRMRLAEKVMQEGLSVRATERLVPLYAQEPVSRQARALSPQSYKRAAKQLRKALAADVRVKQVRGRNKIEIVFEDEDDLARLLSLITEQEA